MKEFKPCPFCGNQPEYNEKSDMVRCTTLDCAIHSWWIFPDEWEKRAETVPVTKDGDDYLAAFKVTETIGMKIHNPVYSD